MPKIDNPNYIGKWIEVDNRKIQTHWNYKKCPFCHKDTMEFSYEIKKRTYDYGAYKENSYFIIRAECTNCESKGKVREEWGEWRGPHNFGSVLVN